MADIKIEMPKKWYTIENLAERWGCSKEEIQHLIETKILTAHKRYEYEHLDDLDGLNNKIRRVKNFVGNVRNVTANIVFDTSQDYLIVIPTEVDRFELERGIYQKADQEEADRPSVMSNNSIIDADISVLADHGKKFIGRGKHPDELSKLLLEIQQNSYRRFKKKLGTCDMWNRLRSEEGLGIIERVDDNEDAIYWNNPKKAEQQKITENALRNRLTGINKLL